MKIVLTYGEGQAVRSRVSDDLADGLLEYRRHCWRKSHVYMMTAYAWRRILDELRCSAYGPKGGKSENSKSLYSAIAKITDAVVGFELHPAFNNGKAVIGGDATVIPAFRQGNRFSPYPTGEFVMLCPHHISKFGHTLTVWREDDWCQSAEDPCHSERFQLLWVVVGEGVGSGGER